MQVQRALLREPGRQNQNNKQECSQRTDEVQAIYKQHKLGESRINKHTQYIETIEKQKQ